jgi:hypothetical protein
MLDDVPCEEAGKAGQALQAAVDSCKIKSMRKCVNTKTGRVVDLIQELHLADEAYRRAIDAFDPQKGEVDDLDQHLDHREQRRMDLLKALLETESWVRSFEDGTDECKKDLPTVHCQYCRKSLADELKRMTHEVTCPEKPAPPPPPLQTPSVVEDSVKARPSNDLKMAEANTSKGCTNGLESGRSNSTEAVSGCTDTEVCKGDLPVHYQYGNTSSADELKRMADEVIVPEGSCPEEPLPPPQPPHTAAADAALSEVIDCKISPRNGQECKVSTHIPDDNTHIKTCVKGERETSSRDGGGEGKEEKVVYAAEEDTTPLFSRKVRPRCENSPKVNEMQEMNDCGAGVGVGRCTLGGCERLDASWSRRVIVAKGTKRCKEALCLIKGALICTANFTFTVKDADGEALRRTHELLAQVPEGLVLVISPCILLYLVFCLVSLVIVR